MTKNLQLSREDVVDRMVTEAEPSGGNAVLAMRFDTSEMGGNWTEICAYGTAVVIEPLVSPAADARTDLVRGLPARAGDPHAGVVHAPGRALAARVPGGAGRRAPSSTAIADPGWPPS